MKAVQKRFCLLRKISTLRVGRANADFLTALMDSFKMSPPATTSKCPEVNSVSVQGNSMVKDVACQVPEVSAPDCRQILSPARVNESFFVCGHESLKVLFYEKLRGCLCLNFFL